MFVSITRLRIRHWRFMPPFLWHTGCSLLQVRRAPSFVRGSLLNDSQRTFWTATVWRTQADMRGYMIGGAHLKAMPRLLDWCDEASIVHWEQDDALLPDWRSADRRMRREGRPSKVRHPAPTHAAMGFAPPGHGRGVPVAPAGNGNR